MLAPPSELRPPRVFRVAFPAVRGESTAGETLRVVAFALGGVAEMAERVAANFERRLQRTKCRINLRLVASLGSEGGAHPASASAHLRKLAHWARPSTITQGTPFLSVLHCPDSCAAERRRTLLADEVLVR